MSSELAAQVAQCAGEVFAPCDTPTATDSSSRGVGFSFLRGVSSLFTGGGSNANSTNAATDLDAIFLASNNEPITISSGLTSNNIGAVGNRMSGGSTSTLGTNSMRSVARQIPVASGNTMDQAAQRGVSAGQAASMAIQVRLFICILLSVHK